jgi:hypothetical protein
MCFLEDKKEEFLPIIKRDDLSKFIELINSNKSEELTSYEYGKYILSDVIQQNGEHILNYLISLNIFDYFNNLEYLNINVMELQSMLSKNQFYADTFSDIDHPLFDLLDNRNILRFYKILELNINVNVINKYGVSLLEYVYFNKKLPSSTRQYMVAKLMEYGAKWEFALLWNNIRLLQLLSIKQKVCKDNANLIPLVLHYKKNPQLPEGNNIRLEKLKIFLADLDAKRYLIKNRQNQFPIRLNLKRKRENV